MYSWLTHLQQCLVRFHIDTREECTFCGEKFPDYEFVLWMLEDKAGWVTFERLCRRCKYKWTPWVKHGLLKGTMNYGST